ncbi:hypothetical protein BDR05DRAFT_492824 [Suillus weaverae]|nr:hypothetical protein BDR05DRAFT_492824 [Suillus weaverae]
MDTRALTNDHRHPPERFQYEHRRLRNDYFTRDHAIEVDAAQWAALGAGQPIFIQMTRKYAKGSDWVPVMLIKLPLSVILFFSLGSETPLPLILAQSRGGLTTSWFSVAIW